MTTIKSTLYSACSVALLASLVTGGCSDDSGPSKTDTTAAKTDTTAAAEDGGSSGDGSSGSGKCTNSADHALLDTKAKRDGVATKAKNCGISCLGATDKKKCATDCIVKGTKLSRGCSACYGDNVLCSANNCLNECAADPNSSLCTKCRDDKGCTKAWETCTGMKVDR